MSTTARPLMLRRPAGAESDVRLARRASRGDERAFEALFVRYRDTLSRYCRAMLRHDQDAEDAFQQAMMRAHGALGRGAAPDGPLRPWLFRIAHNECLRVAGTRHPHAALTEGEPAPGAGPPERAEVREDLAQLRADLLALPQPERAALVMRELNGLSHQQIAAALDATPEGAKRLIHQARSTLGEFGAGRSLACEDVRRRLSDGDGRVLRARAMSSHLRSCEGCREFRAGIATRSRDLAALFPALPAVAMERIAGTLITGGVGAAGIGAGGFGGGAIIAGIGAAGAVVAASALMVTGTLPGAGPDTPAAPGPQPAAATPAAAPASGTVVTPTTVVRDPAAASPRPAAAPPAAGGGGDPTTPGPGGSGGTGGTGAAPGGGTAGGGAGTGGGGTPGGGSGATPRDTSAGNGTAPAGAGVRVGASANGGGVQAGVDVGTGPAVGVGAQVDVAAGGAQGVQAGVGVQVTPALPVPVPLPSATANATVSAGSGGARARADVRATVPPTAGVRADAGVTADVDTRRGVDAGAAVTVATPVTPPVTVDADVRVNREEGVAVEVGPVLGLPPVAVRVPLLGGRR